MRSIYQSRIAVLIPCRDEERSIAETVIACRVALEGVGDFDIYVIDNGSTDNTAMIAETAGAKVIRVDEHGKGVAIMRAFRLIDAEIYAMLDGDSTYKIDEIAPFAKPLLHTMIETVENGEADMVIGNRLGSYAESGSKPFHYAGNLMFRWAVKSLFHKDIKDPLSGLRAISRDFARSFPGNAHGFEIEMEMNIHAGEYGFAVREYNVRYLPRPKGSNSKLSTFKDGARIMAFMLAAVHDKRPVLFYGTLAALIAAPSLWFFLDGAREYLETGTMSRFPRFIVGSVGLLFSALFVSIGAVLSSVNRHAREIKRGLLAAMG